MRSLVSIVSSLFPRPGPFWEGVSLIVDIQADVYGESDMECLARALPASVHVQAVARHAQVYRDVDEGGEGCRGRRRPRVIRMSRASGKGVSGTSSGITHLSCI